MKQTYKILFVCTGNTFRSFSAAYCFKNFLKRHNISGIEVSSAGIEAKEAVPDQRIIQELKRLNVSTGGYKQKKLTRDLFRKYDLVIAMAKEHQKFIKKNYGSDVPLFLELALGKLESIRDIDAAAIDSKVAPEENRRVIERYIVKVVRLVNSLAPNIYKQIQNNNLLFVNFLRGIADHGGGYPYMSLYETKYSVAFMSLSIPEKEDAHILVIPKELYKRLEDIPPAVQTDLIQSVSVVGRALMQFHDGYNVWLNNCAAAGQCIFHTHFHVIPRKRGDDIRIEVWRKKKFSVKKFIELNNRFKKSIDIVTRSKA